MSGTVLRFRGILGVPVELQGSILLLAGLFYLVTQDVVAASILFGVVFGSIYLHELGHAFGAISQGVPVKRIVINGGGGFCENAATARPRQSEFIVIMGPLTNLVIWAVVSLSLQMWPPESALWERALELTGRLNLFLALFNLLPIQPLDGGKLLFLYLIRVISPLYATRICGWIGLIAAVLWIPLIYVSIVYLGFVLLFFPSFKLHWELARAKNEN